MRANHLAAQGLGQEQYRNHFTPPFHRASRGKYPKPSARFTSRHSCSILDHPQADCPIRHIITVQALKEGWDCSWAYVLCSVANIRSAKDIEQLLGRVLRMPSAQASHFDPLNRAYAHVTHGRFQSTAAQLRDALITLGFDRTQASEAIQSPLLPPDDDLLATRRGTTLALAGPPPDLDGLSGDSLAGITLLQQSESGIQLSIDPATAPAAIERLCERLPANHRQHRYPSVGEMNQPETELAVVLDAPPEVEVWLRNFERHSHSFRLPCPAKGNDWFYPDFLARLHDGRVLVMEYKGSHIGDGDKAKRQIGLAWQRAMQGRGLFLWIGDSEGTAQGRGIAQQILARLGSSS